MGVWPFPPSTEENTHGIFFKIRRKKKLTFLIISRKKSQHSGLNPQVADGIRITVVYLLKRFLGKGQSLGLHEKEVIRPEESIIANQANKGDKS